MARGRKIRKFKKKLRFRRMKKSFKSKKFKKKRFYKAVRKVINSEMELKFSDRYTAFDPVVASAVRYNFTFTISDPNTLTL